jgi:hypothetical protein
MDPKRKFEAELTVKDKTWHEAICFETGFSVRWILIVELPVARITLGLSDGESWLRINPTTVSVLQTKNSLVSFLPILEEAPEDFWNRLRDGLEVQGIDGSHAARFPIEDVVLTGLRSGSQHWCWRALQWISSIPLSPEINATLAELVLQGKTQKIRHQSRKLGKYSR